MVLAAAIKRFAFQLQSGDPDSARKAIAAPRCAIIDIRSQCGLRVGGGLDDIRRMASIPLILVFMAYVLATPLSDERGGRDEFGN